MLQVLIYFVHMLKYRHKHLGVGAFLFIYIVMQINFVCLCV
jgi:heme/copper-type cytochrome/quinol oxidase subunit 4